MDDFRTAVIQTLADTTCGHCDFDEAEGVIIDHCDVCCRKIVAQIWQLALRGDPEGE